MARVPAGLALAPLLLAACTTAAGGVLPSTTTTADPQVTAPIDAPPEPGVALPDLTARPITADDLTAMLPAGETGVALAEGGVAVTERSNETLITTAVLDREDEVDDIERTGRVTGVAGTYRGPDHDAHVWIDVLNDSSGAHDWLNDVAGDIVKRTGGSHAPDIELLEADEYPVEGVGDGAIGLVLEIRSGDASLHETIVLFRMGRIVAFVSVVDDQPGDARVPGQYLAEEVEGRILDILLQRTPDSAQDAGPDGYRFDYRQVVTVEGEQWSTTAEGVVSGGDVSCRVRLDRPDLSADRDYVVVDGRVWSRDSGPGDYEESPAASVLDRSLLAYCPLWPIDLFEAGLAAVAQGTPARYEVAGVAALGYRGTAEQLTAILGGPQPDLTVDILNVWVAEGTTWLVELDASLTAESADLAQLIGPGYPDGTTQVSMRHRVSDLGEAPAVTPPG